ncbi:MAG: DUF3536 domain-containing protein [Desulfovibrio sp.]|jgi:alpha-amylase/alpha-mannosidase (GH57 family)|nr:DUF3536 domain-containing protein [Desulfovibrio sp.]
MGTELCIHGHFYQPPREDPWLGGVLAESSAAPMLNWNERILRESYAPLSFARRLDSEGRIADIMNCYEWINFNVGPTLLRWMRSSSPETVRRMREGDANSLARWGHGNAMAQVYHHIIMPLATDEDRRIETHWAIEDFRFHFGRAPEGMWLPECAVDLPSLETLAGAGISFVVLAPRQAKAVILGGRSVPVTENSLDCGEPYKISLPSGKSIQAVFYNGNLSQSIAFEGLLRSGEDFWRRIAEESATLPVKGRKSSLLTLATDGETYGHHFVFGEMALAYVLAQGYAGRDDISLTNIGAYIAAHPPRLEVELHEPSSWSCTHGVGRWMRDCGCRDGGHSDWNQKWRGPLRDALNLMRFKVREHFDKAGGDCFTDKNAALLDYGRVLTNPKQGEDFARVWIKDGKRDMAFKLLDMQEQSLAAFASCAWFFDDIARIEPENAMIFSLRAMELLLECRGPDIREDVAKVLEKACSNQSGAGTGRDVFEHEAVARSQNPASLCLLALALSDARGKALQPGESIRQDWPRLSVEVLCGGENPPQGTAIIRSGHEDRGMRHHWRMENVSGADNPPLAEMSLSTFPEDPASGRTSSRSIRDFARPLLDWLQTTRLDILQQKLEEELSVRAAQAASLILPWEEWQSGVPRPDLWAGLAPYLALEYMNNRSLEEKKRLQLGAILIRLLDGQTREMTARLLNRDILAALDAGESDAALALMMRRARQIIPDMDWWEAQNRIWLLGPRRYPQCARELNFFL